MRVEISGSGKQGLLKSLIDLQTTSVEIVGEQQSSELEIGDLGKKICSSLSDFKVEKTEHVSHPADKGKGKHNKRRY